MSALPLNPALAAEALREYRAERDRTEAAVAPQKAVAFSAEDTEVDRLAELDPIAYDREREAAAESLGCRVSTLDKLVAARRSDCAASQAIALCSDIEPCAEPVDNAELLNAVRATIARFIVCEPATATAATLWIAFTWIVDHAQVAPLAIITAPEKGCGKTQLLDVIGRLSRRPLFASNITPPATFRVIEAKSPTLLIDEADAFFRENEELRGVINSGHTRPSAYVIRTVGDDFEVKQFSTWGAKAIAGIGRLPETVMSRGIVLNLRRKLKTEKVDRLRHADPLLFEALARKLARFGQDRGVAIGRARPQVPEALDDRQQDNWEHLLTIADFAGGKWPAEARRAALTICGADGNDLSLGEQLLLAIRDAFEQDGADKLSREELLRRLVADDEGPWATWNKGRPLSASQLRTRLVAYSIKTKKVRLDSYTTAQGFERKQFADAWGRYLDGVDDPSPESPPQNRNNGTSEADVDIERSEAVPVPNSKRNGGADDLTPVPNSKWNWNTNGTSKSPENRECSNVPFPAPLAGEDMPKEWEADI